MDNAPPVALEKTRAPKDAPLPRQSTPLFVAMASFLVPFLLCAIVVRQLIDVQEREIVYEANYWGQAFVTKLQGRLEANLALGRGIDAQISVLGDISQESLEALAPRLLEPDLSIRHIAVAPDLVVSAVYPLEGNQAALGLNYMTQLNQRDEALKAVDLNRIVLAGPLDLVQGIENQLVARFPVFNADGSVWGLVAIVIDVETLVESADSETLTKKYDVGLRKISDTEPATLFYGNSALFGSDAAIFPVQVPGGEWQLALRPLNGWPLPASQQFNYWALAVLLCALLSLAMFFYRRNIQHQKEHVQLLEAVLSVDPLTKLMSRYKFSERLGQLVEEYAATNQRFTVLLIDLDHFKEINDSLGHHAGDELLTEVARRLESCVRADDLIGRLGGDEFIVVLKGISRAVEIESRAYAITSKLADRLAVSDMEVNITCSVGVAVYPQDGEDANSLIQHADLAMFQSKRAGRNTLYFFNASQRDEADRYVKLHAELKSALTFAQLQVYYQPIYNVRRKCFSHCEALSRWPKEDGSFVSPVDFIPVAEQSGLICDLGVWLVEEVCRVCQSMIQEGHDINFAINRSPNEFGSAFHVKKLLALVNEYDIPRQQMTLEITESLLMSDHGIKLDNFKMLRAQGFNFSIDDFGTGYSAISYLRKFPVGSLKIDKSFITEMGKTSQADTLVKVIIQLAKTLGIAVVAEGVETKEQFDLLCAMGCDYLQGYYLARPMPEKQFREFVANPAANHVMALHCS